MSGRVEGGIVERGPPTDVPQTGGTCLTLLFFRFSRFGDSSTFICLLLTSFPLQIYITSVSRVKNYFLEAG